MLYELHLFYVELQNLPVYLSYDYMTTLRELQLGAHFWLNYIFYILS